MTTKVVKSSNRGAKPGERRGGRVKGAPNNKTQEMQTKVASEGITPLDYLLSVMRNAEADEGKRIDCAKAAAQYVHPKLASIEGKATVDAVVEYSWQG